MVGAILLSSPCAARHSAVQHALAFTAQLRAKRTVARVWRTDDVARPGEGSLGR
jgi:hypothetical protein